MCASDARFEYGGRTPRKQFEPRGRVGLPSIAQNSFVERFEYLRIYCFSADCCYHLHHQGLRRTIAAGLPSDCIKRLLSFPSAFYPDLGRARMAMFERDTNRVGHNRGSIKTPLFVVPSTKSTQRHRGNRASVFRVVCCTPCVNLHPVGALLILEAVWSAIYPYDMHLAANTQFNSRR